jgi:hypothetical protein
MYKIKFLLFRIYIWVHTLFLRIGIAVAKAEEVVGINEHAIGENKKFNIRVRHRNPVINKLLEGQRDEKFVQDYYEILRKADKFMKTATPEQMAIAADKHGLNYGLKDRWGRRYEHYGFFDPKHKNYGMTLGEAMAKEAEERTTKDDNYKVEFMYDNRPIAEGLAGSKDFIEKDDEVFEALSEVEKAKLRRFPIKIIRDENRLNKIEQLAEFLHVKKITDEHKILEFFIPKKFKLTDHLNSSVYNELISIKQVWVKDDYGIPFGYSVSEHYKFLDYDQLYDVIKFKGTLIKQLTI